jgi:hypothetical protein
VELCEVAAREVEVIESEWREYLGDKQFDAMRAALIALREVTDPYR